MQQYKIPIEIESEFQLIEDVYYEIKIRNQCLRGMTGRLDMKKMSNAEMYNAMMDEKAYWDLVMKEICSKLIQSLTEESAPDDVFCTLLPEDIINREVTIVSINSDIDKLSRYIRS